MEHKREEQQVTAVIEERLEELESVELECGGHSPNSEKKMCVMEAVAYVAGEEWSDSPECASPVISAFMRRWNDDLGSEGRQRLKAYIPRLVGTVASAEIEEQRAFMAGDWLVRVHTPAWLELAGVTDAAEALRALRPLMDVAAVKAAQAEIDQAKSRADAARDAARAAARDAARAAARDAAWAAARAAAWAAARDAAWDAARAAAWAAARAAAWTAARAALEPTKVELQESAFELLDRMIEVGNE